MADYIVEPPRDLPLSTKVKALRKEYEDAKAKLSTYKQENARYRTRDVSQVGEVKARYSTPALEDAKADLKALEIQAVKEGKALPDKGKFLGAVKAKTEEYDRTVSALEFLVARARKAFDDGVKEELVPMGRKEAAKAAQARDAWEKAYKAAMAARETLEKHAGLFSYCVTAGGMDVHPRHGHSQGDRLECWELNEDGLLTWEASQELDYGQIPVKVSGLIESDPNPPVVEEFNDNPKPRYFIAKADGYGNNWEH
ncbi:hypothetical protein OHB56_05200 [Streptomyces sp. NBC_01635]|uniref:hypothetical protein n=1 Tax=Streptomyces sp. NBC_01635 TaxID=2975904 RepID=UPI00386D0827|nr:hypothetical protein OHB56_05200 [Streptomyces sp. NBC_01635]